MWFHLNPDLALRITKQVDRSDARDCTQLWHNSLIQIGTERFHIHIVGFKYDRHYRIRRRVITFYNRLLNLITKFSSYRSDFIPHVLSCCGRCHIQIKFSGDDGQAFTGLGNHLFQTGNGIDLIFEFLGDFRFNRFRRSARIVGIDHHKREIDIRKFFNAHSLPGSQSQYHQTEHHHDGENRILHTNSGKPHINDPV